MSSADFYEYDTCMLVDAVKAAELSAVDYDTPVYKRGHFQVIPTIALTIAGEPIVKYGVFNIITGVMEAEASQLVTARSWCNALNDAEKSEKKPDLSALPGLSPEGGVH